MTNEEKLHVLLFGLGACVVLAYGLIVRSAGVVAIGACMGLLFGAADTEAA